MKQPPAFQFYASDYLSSSKVQRMSLEAEGAYIRLLAYNWQDGFIPADVAQLARMCKCSPKKMAVLWDQFLRECFEPCAADPDKLINSRLEEVRSNLLTFKAERSESGSNGAAKRWRNHGSAMAQPSNSHGSAIEEPIANDGSPVSSLQSPSPVHEKKESPSEIPKKPKLLTFGEFGNVRLTEEQLFKLQAKLNGRTDEYFARFDGWVEEAPRAKDRAGVMRKDRNPYATIGNWFNRDANEGKHGTKTAQESPAEARFRQTKEAGQRLLARIAAQSSGGVPSGSDGGHTSGVPRTIGGLLAGED